ncbi:MAG: mechanosensitive ion channel [Bacilli bacterium]|nr:mechanosensitive ion channel [Bacilli bacterium]
MNWEEIWGQITAYFQNNVWNIVLFFAVLVFGLLFIKVILLVTRSLLRKHGMDPIAIRFLSATLRFFLLLVEVLVLLSIIGVPITGLTTTVSAIVLAVGVALKEFLSNVASGIILVGSRKYKTGDYIQVAGVEGSIVDINFLFTTLKTPNSTQVTLPNSTMVNSPVTNLGAYESRRVAITFSVAYESDTELVQKTLLDVMNSCGMVYQDPAPTCQLKTLGASSIDFFLTCFCDNADYWNVYYYVMDYGFNELKKAGIGFPFQQVEVTNKPPIPMVIADKPLPERVEKKRTRKLRRLTLEEIEDMTFGGFKKYVHEKAEENKEKKATKKKEKASKKPSTKKKTKQEKK